ncbi:MAG: DUF1993 domain-containing protein [Pseudomonadota bacterium]|jgi:hypothetical protein|nr:DUF1993 domain-containing protein [Pseudomonadota bacterium]
MGDTVSFMLKSATAQILPAMASTLRKGRESAIDRSVAEDVILSARLAPDMLPLLNQYQLAADTAARGAARLAGHDMPSFPDEETSVDELLERLDKTNAYVQGFEDADLDANERTVLEIPLGPMTVHWEGRQYLSTFVLPNLHFHATIAFALLRHQGVEIGKRDFLMA